ncbi:MAG: hypothetical protein IKX14_06170, partial [Neisseriaceae bacterium]|nr:hypothetical protein [Neisseriaceae bacterium]
SVGATPCGRPYGKRTFYLQKSVAELIYDFIFSGSLKKNAWATSCPPYNSHNSLIFVIKTTKNAVFTVFRQPESV